MLAVKMKMMMTMIKEGSTSQKAGSANEGLFRLMPSMFLHRKAERYIFTKLVPITVTLQSKNNSVLA